MGRKIIKITHITLSMDVGGVENFIVNFSKKLNCQDYNLTVICLDSGGILLDEIHKLGFRSIVLSRRPGIDFSLILKLARIFRNEQFDIVHTHNQASHFYAGLAAKIAGIPGLLTTEHSRHYIDGKVIRRVEKFFLSLITDCWVTVSNELLQQSIVKDRLFRTKVKIIQNGIDVDSYTPANLFSKNDSVSLLKKESNLPDNARIVIMVARLHPIKNHKLLIQAIAEIQKKIDNVHAILIGDGEMKHDLKELAEKLHVNNNVHFLGYKKDIAQMLWMSDVFVLCSETEGMPLSLLEAMAAKIPIVITRPANKAELIKNGVTGMVIENSVSALAAALTQQLEIAKHKNECAERAHEFVLNHYSLVTMMKQYEALYRDMVF